MYAMPALNHLTKKFVWIYPCSCIKLHKVGQGYEIIQDSVKQIKVQLHCSSEGSTNYYKIIN